VQLLAASSCTAGGDVPPVDSPTMSGQPVEVTCDESGAEGEKLVGGNTDVFCHASIRLTVAEAADCVDELRRMIRSPAAEYKAILLLREKNRFALDWFLGPLGPVHGRANAFLVDKTYLLLLRFADRLARTPPFASDLGERAVEDLATALYRAAGPAWTPFLALLNEVMRWGRVGDNASTDELVALADALVTTEPPGTAQDVLTLFARYRSDVDTLLRPVTQPDPTTRLAMDQLLPAILRAVDCWGADGEPVFLVHDMHRTLTDTRMAQLVALRRGRLSSMRLARAGADPRVQVADFLAGVARKVASDELAGTADPALSALVRDHVDPRSVWCDQASWARVGRTA
jgi:hypothetical protein